MVISIIILFGIWYYIHINKSHKKTIICSTCLVIQIIASICISKYQPNKNIFYEQYNIKNTTFELKDIHYNTEDIPFIDSITYIDGTVIYFNNKDIVSVGSKEDINKEDDIIGCVKIDTYQYQLVNKYLQGIFIIPHSKTKNIYNLYVYLNYDV